MPMCDWSSDVCSSDLRKAVAEGWPGMSLSTCPRASCRGLSVWPLTAWCPRGSETLLLWLKALTRSLENKVQLQIPSLLVVLITFHSLFSFRFFVCSLSYLVSPCQGQTQLSQRCQGSKVPSLRLPHGCAALQPSTCSCVVIASCSSLPVGRYLRKR